MRPLLRFGPRRTVVLAIAVTAALSLAPTMAMAVDSTGPASRAPATPETPETPDTSESEEPAAATTSCDDLLVTFTRDGSTGDDHSVALTAQSIDRDVDGWALVAWESAEGTHLTAVLATDADGTTRALDPTPTGTVREVAMLAFCGTTTLDTEPDADGSTPDADGSTPDHEGEETAVGQPTEPTQPTQPEAATSCDDLLVTFTRDGSTGDEHSVALTAQSIDRDANGWGLLAWETAEGTHLTAVLATDTDGATRALDPTPTGTVHDVTTLTFCGTAATASEQPLDRTDEVVKEQLEPSNEVSTTTPMRERAPRAPRAPASSPASPAADPGAAGSGPADAGPAATEYDEGVDDASDEDSDVEVLGIQRVAPIEPLDQVPAAASLRPSGDTAERTQPIVLAGNEPRLGVHPLLLAALFAAAIAGIAGGGSVLEARSNTTTASTTTDTEEANR